jgi:hypothetical protein
MDIKTLRPIPHELRAFQWDGVTRYPWIATMYGDGSASLRYHIYGCHDDGEMSGSYIIYKDDWVSLDADDEPIEILQSITGRYTIHD